MEIKEKQMIGQGKTAEIYRLDANKIFWNVFQKYMKWLR